MKYGKKILNVLCIALFALITTSSFNGRIVSAAGTWNETYRPQFHFTPGEHWMNDPNGMVYYGGEYHLFYQYNPNDTVWGPMHWGHAISTDMVNWKEYPIALYPDSIGTIFSGSAVVDWNNTAGFQTGKEKTIVAIFTHDRGVGTECQSIAYSNDKGRTWTKYEGNPVLPYGGQVDFRDPKVFWHDATNKWVMVVTWGQAVRFYTSPDLKNWTYASQFGDNDGYHISAWECPDLYELPVDGNTTNKKWVLSVNIGAGTTYGGGGTQYFVGDFNGTTFTNSNSPDTVLWLTNGKDDYAGVTFSDVPDGRRIFMGWQTDFEYYQSTPTTPWRSNFTIPRSLSLCTLPEGIRLIQTPITELQSLRGTPSNWSNIVLSPGTNLLSDKSGKQFELVAEFKVDSSCTASEFGFRVRKGGSQYTTIGYNRATSKMFIDRTNSGVSNFSTEFAERHEVTLNPVNNTIKLHAFIDWSSVELFGNDGQQLLSDLIYPDAASMGIEAYSTDGNVTLNSLIYYPMNSADFGYAYVDDSASEVTYNGTWNAITNDPIYYENTCHFGNTANGYIQYTFNGTAIDWYGLKNVDLGKADVYIDNVLKARGVDCYSATRAVQKLYGVKGLENSSHTIKIVVTGTKNPLSAGTYLVHDYFDTTNTSVTIDDASDSVTYNGTWKAVNNDSIYCGNTCHYGNITNGFIQSTFSGTGVDWYGLKNTDLGKADVYIDNVLKKSGIDCYGTKRAVHKLFSISGLESGNHTIKVVITGTKNAASTGTYIVHDSFIYSNPTGAIATSNYYDVTAWNMGVDPHTDIGAVINSIIADVKYKQANINDNNGGKPGAVIFIPEGDYHLLTQVTIDVSYIKIIGAGHGFTSSSIRFNSDTTNWNELWPGGSRILNDMATNSNTTVRDGAAFVVTRDGNPRLSGIEFENFSIDGVHFVDYSSGASNTENTYTNRKTGIYIETANDSFCIRNMGMVYLEHGIVANSSDAMNITDNFIAECGNGIEMRSSCITSKINNNFIGAGYIGYSIYVENTTNISIFGNNIFPRGESSIRFVNVSNSSITGNQLHSFYPGMIVLENNCNDNLVASNNLLRERETWPPMQMYNNGKDDLYGIIQINGNNNAVMANKISVKLDTAYVNPAGSRVTVIHIITGTGNYISNNDITGATLSGTDLPLYKVLIRSGVTGNKVLDSGSDADTLFDKVANTFRASW